MVNRSREYQFYWHRRLDNGWKIKITLHGLVMKDIFRMSSVCLTNFRHGHKIVTVTYLNNYKPFIKAHICYKPLFHFANLRSLPLSHSQSVCCTSYSINTFPNFVGALYLLPHFYFFTALGMWAMFSFHLSSIFFQ
jgi:hypothetical protein